MGGFQLWANLPAARKMMPPRYREVKREQIPEVDTGGGAVIRVICGAVEGIRGPVQDIVTDPSYLDVRLQPESRFIHPTPPGHTVFAYLIGGRVRCGTELDRQPRRTGARRFARRGGLLGWKTRI